MPKHLQNGILICNFLKTLRNFENYLPSWCCLSRAGKRTLHLYVLTFGAFFTFRVALNDPYSSILVDSTILGTTFSFTFFSSSSNSLPFLSVMVFTYSLGFFFVLLCKEPCDLSNNRLDNCPLRSPNS